MMGVTAGHAWWHLIMSFNATLGAVFIQYIRAHQLGMRPLMRQKWGVPYVVTLKLD